MLTRPKPWYKNIASIYRDSRSRAGSMTAFILTLRGVYLVPVRTVGVALATLTAAVPFPFFYTKIMKARALAREEEAAASAMPAPSTQAIQEKLRELAAKELTFIKYLDAVVAFLGQFGNHHMEMMITAAIFGFEFVDYENPAPKNFVMLVYAAFAFYHSAQVLMKTKNSYEQQKPLAADTATPIVLEIKIDNMLRAEAKTAPNSSEKAPDLTPYKVAISP